MKDFDPIFLDLTSRWVSAARPGETDGDAPVAVHFPARLVAGPVSEVETQALLYGHRAPALFAVGGGIVRVGGPPVAPGPFVRRSGSVLPTGGGADDEDALLAVAAIAALGGRALSHDLVVMTSDGNDASRLSAAFSRLAGQVQPLDDEPLSVPRTVSVLSPEAIEGIRLAAVQRKWIEKKEDSRQALIYAAGGSSRIWATTEAGIEPLPLPDSGLYPRWEAQFLGSASDAVLGPSEALQYQYSSSGERALVRNSSGEIVPFEASKAIASVEKDTIAAWIEELGDTFTTVRALFTDATVVGPDAPLYTICLKHKAFNAVLQRDFVNGFSIYACRAYISSPDMHFLHAAEPTPAVGAASYLERRRRRVPPVSFRDDSQEFVLRLPISFIDAELAITLRAFAQSTRPSDECVHLLSRLIRIERK